MRSLLSDLRDKCPADSAQATISVCNVVGFCLFPSDLLESLNYLPSVSRSPCPWAKLRESLQQTQTLASHHLN